MPSVPDQYAAGIIIFNQGGFPVFINLQNTEGRIGHLTGLAHRKGFCNRRHTFLNAGTVFQHRPHNFCCQRGKDIGFNAAAHPIG